MSEQFVFGPEHVGKDVDHVLGGHGYILSIDNLAPTYEQLAVKWSDTTVLSTYSVTGKTGKWSDVYIHLSSEPINKERYEPVITPTSQPAPAPETDYEETPFIPNRAEVWARFMAASIARENIRNIDEAAGFADRAVKEYEKRFLNQ